MKNTFGGLAALVFLALCPLSESQAAGELRIETINGPPWGFVGSDGGPTGMMFEIGNRIAEIADIPHTNKLVPYARLAVDINEGAADLVLQFPNKTISKGSIEVTKLVTMPIIVVGPVGSKFKSLKELNNKLVGVIRTASYVKEFDNNDNIKKYDVTDYTVMARLIKLKRLDAGIGSSVGFYYSAKVAGIKPEELSPPLVVGTNYFAVNLSKVKADPKTVKAIDEAVKKMKATGEIKRIIDKYMGEYAGLEKL